MKTHTQGFKEQIKEMGRELDSIITYTIDNEEIELGSEELNSITPHYEGNILKSVMKQLDIDSNVDIPLGTEINYQFGLKIGDEYEYLNYGNYIVYSSEKQEDTNSYKIVAYDKMLFSMVDYEALNITYPITIRNYINAICNHLGLTFKNASDTFVNYDKEISNELYLDSDGNSLGYTFRDVLDELSQVTASTICLDENDELEIRYITLTGDTTQVEGTSIYIDDAVKQGILYEGINNITQTNNDLPFELELEYISFDDAEVIDEEYLKDINVNFGEKYGPINTISFKRSADSDVISKSIPEDLPDDEKIEIAISDNQILNGNNRDEFIDGILNKLYGLEYYTNDFSSTGICYLDLCDRYFVKVNDKYYSCIMFNDEINITQGLEENIHTDLPSESETDYTKADKTDRRINNVSLIVDKQEQEIRSLAEKVVDISKTTSGTGSITLENAYAGILHRLEITGNLTLLYPRNTLYPSNTLYPLDTYLLVDNDRYKLDIDYLIYTDSEHYDKYVYEDGKQWIERINGTIEEKEDIEINVDANSYIRLESYGNANLKAIYLLENDYTDTFATQVEVNSQIRQTADEINLEVSKKVDGNEVISVINQSPEQITLSANRLVINSTGFQLNGEGNMVANGGTVGGWSLGDTDFYNIIRPPYDYTQADYERIRNITLGTITPTQEDYQKYDFDKNNEINTRDLLFCKKLIAYNIGYSNPAKLLFDVTDWFYPIKIVNNSNEVIMSVGINGIYQKEVQ